MCSHIIENWGIYVVVGLPIWIGLVLLTCKILNSGSEHDKELKPEK